MHAQYFAFKNQCSTYLLRNQKQSLYGILYPSLHMHTHTHSHTSTHTHTYPHTPTHTYTCTHTHTHTHTELKQAGISLRLLIQSHFSHLLSSRTVRGQHYHHCCSGLDLVDWVISAEFLMIPLSRKQAVGVWQVLLKEGVISGCGKKLNFVR